MDTHHCPRCELRFVTTSELRHHFTADHGGDAGTFERYRYRAGPTDASAPRTLLVVGNQSLEDDRVLDEVVTRARAHDRVIVLVPATSGRLQQLPGTAMGGGDEAVGTALARHRLAAALGQLGAAGIEAEGRIGDADPFAATTRLLADEPVDSIVVSTLPASSSRWLGVDFPGRLRRATHRPVDVLTPTPADLG